MTIKKKKHRGLKVRKIALKASGLIGIPGYLLGRSSIVIMTDRRSIARDSGTAIAEDIKVVSTGPDLK